MNMIWEIIFQAMRMANDIFLTVFFFWKAPAAEGNMRIIKRTAGIFCLLLVLPLYITERISVAYFLDSTILRYGIRLASIWGYIYFFKGMEPLSAFYWAMLLNTCFSECHNLFMTPFLRDVRLGSIQIVSSEIWSGFLAALLECVIFILIVAAMRSNIKSFQIRNNLRIRILLVAVTMLLTLYIKSTLRFYTSYEMWAGGSVEMVFPIIMVVLILLLITMMERFWVFQDLKIQYEAQRLAEDYRYQNLLDKIQAQEDVRRLYHDMKNHLNVLDSMSKDDEGIRTYIRELRGRLGSYEKVVNCGNDTLDMLLSQKLKAAREQEIAMSIFMDFSRGDFMSPLDICTIFGNALDNAMEAAAKVEDAAGRLIFIRSQEFADQLIIKIRNCYQGEIQFSKGLPLTSKEANQHYHGLGVSNIVRAVKKYGGVTSIDLPEKGVFELKIMLPLPQSQK